MNTVKAATAPERNIPQRISAMTSFKLKIFMREEVKLRVIERGVGETLACGSGACAAVIYGVKSGILDSRVNVHLNGGDALVEFDGDKVFLSGPGEFVYEGSLNLRSGSI